MLAAGQAALKSYDWLAEPNKGRLARVKKLATIGELDGSLIDTVPGLGHAAIYAGERSRRAQSKNTQAKVTPETWDKASAKKKRMLSVLGYVFEDDEDMQSELTAIKSGWGYVDCSCDLTALSELYSANRTELSGDKKYRAEDAQEAQDLASQILKELRDTSTTEAADWMDKAARVYTLLEPAYPR